MAHIINFIFDDKAVDGSLLDIHVQSLFEGVQKAGEGFVQQLISYLFMTISVLPSAEYLWNVLQRVAVFIPYIIYTQYEYYKLKKRIYELTWTLNYQSRKGMFRLVPPSRHMPTQVSNTRNSYSMNKRTDDIPVPVADIFRRAQSSSCVSASASAHSRLRGWNTMEMGDMSRSSHDSGMPKVKSTPTMVHEIKLIAFNESEDSTLLDEISQARIPMSLAKKIKMDHGDHTTSHDSVLSVFSKPRDFNPQKIVVEYCQILEKQAPTKSRSALSSDKSTAVGRFPKRYPSSLMIRNSLGKRSASFVKSNDSVPSCRQETESDRKWKNIFERTEALRNQRIARMREMEMKKMQEKEKQRKMEIMRRRAVRAKIREENKRILLREKSATPSFGDSQDILIGPVVINSNSTDPINLQGQGDQYVCWNPIEPVPVLRVTQRTVRIEHTSKKIGKKKETKTENSTCSRESDGADIFNVLEASDKIVDQHSEFFLIPTVPQRPDTPESKRFVYVEMRSDKSDQKSCECASLDEIIGNWDSTECARNQPDLARMCQSYDDLRGSKDTPIPDGVVATSTQVKNIASEFEKLAGGMVNNKKEKLPTANQQNNSIIDSAERAEDGEKFPKVNTRKPSFPPEVEGGRPVIKRVKRRLKKTLNRTDVTINGSPLLGEALHVESTKPEGCSPKKEVPHPPLTDVNNFTPKSLVQKKLEVRKRLESRIIKASVEIPFCVPEMTKSDKESTEKLSEPKLNRSAWSQSTKTTLATRNRRVGKFSSKSTVSLRDSPSSKRIGKTRGRPLKTRAYLGNSRESVSSLLLSDDHIRETSTVREKGYSERHVVCGDSRSKVMEHFKDPKKTTAGLRKHRRVQKRKKLVQLLDSFKSEIKDVITATASSLSRLSEPPQHEVKKSSSADGTEKFAATTSRIDALVQIRHSSDGEVRSENGVASHNIVGEIENATNGVPSGETKATSRKMKGLNQGSNARSTVNPQPRWNNAAILRARYIEKTRRPELKQTKKLRGANNCHSLPSSPRAPLAVTDQAEQTELSKSLPPTPR